MPDGRYDILLIEAGETAPPLPLETVLNRNTDRAAYEVERVASVAAAEDRLRRRLPDLVVLEVDAQVRDIPAITAEIEELHRHSLGRPIVVLSSAIDPAILAAIYRAGARRCLHRDEALMPTIVRVIRILRGHDDPWTTAADHLTSAYAEMGRLGMLHGPPPSPITARSLGIRPLAERYPREFRELGDRCCALLDMALDRRCLRDAEDDDQEMAVVVNRLGSLGAGPRDVIDIYKTAITEKMRGKPQNKARGYVEEGRFLVLKIMGNLVAYYQALSWGRGPAPREDPDWTRSPEQAEKEGERRR
jgi:DNA-binding NarL/FixJ family response regulator